MSKLLRRCCEYDPGVRKRLLALLAGSAALAAACSTAAAPAGPRAARLAHVRVPGCSAATAPGRALTAVRTSMISVSGPPFGVVTTAGGRWDFVSLVTGIGVFRNSTAGQPELVRKLPVPGVTLGLAVSPDGRYLLAADGDGAVVISVSRAEAGQPHAVLGTLAAGPAHQGGAIEVAVTPDGRYAFVSLEYSHPPEIAVFNLQRALTSGFRRSLLVGEIPVDPGPVGLAVSPGGRLLYATSEADGQGFCRAPQVIGEPGALAVISIRTAETDPAGSVLATVQAGANPVRVITSASGSVVWVTARQSNALLAFSARRLLTAPAGALLAKVTVGPDPVGLALVNGGRAIVVADSDRFARPGTTSTLAVVGVADALAGRPAVLGYIKAGSFPRQLALEPDGRTLLVTNYFSNQLETVELARLP